MAGSRDLRAIRAPSEKSLRAAARVRTLLLACGAAVLAGLVVVPPAIYASGYTQSSEVVASNGSATDTFGYAVALAGGGSTALVGAPFINGLTGEAYAFTPSGTTWSQQAGLVAGDGALTDTFGSAVALSNSGSIALIGAPGKSAATGAAYFDSRSGSTWTQAQELPGTAASGFGVSVSLSSDGSTALVGANLAGTSAGAAYVYEFSGGTWSLQQQLTPTVASAAGDQFGDSVSLSSDGSTALVGAPDASTAAGTAYVFTRSGTTWTQQQQINAAIPAGGDMFGSSVSLSGDATTALIGTDGAGTNKGTAYVFTHGATWTQQAQISAADGATGDQFGASVSLDGNGNTAVVGAPQRSSLSGAAYIFSRSGTTWTQAQELTAGDAAADHLFGKSVATSTDGNTILIGEDSKSTAGAAYFFVAPTASPSPSPTASVLPAVPPTGAAGGSELPGVALVGGGLALLLFGAVAWRRRSTLP
jgi:FG-GAP repeat